MKVTLLHHSPLWLASHAIRMSHDNHDKSDTFGLDQRCHMYSNSECGKKDKALIHRVGNKMKHKSVLEQLVYWFDIDGISRACLQELARHRTARLTVKSSRYTLNELKNEKPFLVWNGNANETTREYELSRVADWCVLHEKATVDDYAAIGDVLTHICSCLQDGGSNDISKYMLPEAFKTRLQWQVDGRNLQNFLALRTSKDALWEIQLLARAIYGALPSEHKYLYSEYIMDSISPDVADGTPETTE